MLPEEVTAKQICSRWGLDPAEVRRARVRAEQALAADPACDTAGLLIPARWEGRSPRYAVPTVLGWLAAKPDRHQRTRDAISALEAEIAADQADIERDAQRERELSRETHAASAPIEREISELEDRRVIDKRLSASDQERLNELRTLRDAPEARKRALQTLRNRISAKRDAINDKRERLSQLRKDLAQARAQEVGERLLPNLIEVIRGFADVGERTEGDGFLLIDFTGPDGLRVVVRSAQANIANPRAATSITLENFYLAETPDPDSDEIVNEPTPPGETDAADFNQSFPATLAAAAPAPKVSHAQPDRAADREFRELLANTPSTLKFGK